MAASKLVRLTLYVFRSAVLFPMAVTVYITWWFLTFFDKFFSVSTPVL